MTNLSGFSMSLAPHAMLSRGYGLAGPPSWAAELSRPIGRGGAVRTRGPLPPK